MQVIQISYNEKSNTTKLVFTRGFQDMDLLTRIDMLRDAISTLEECHDLAINQHREYFDSLREKG